MADNSLPIIQESQLSNASEIGYFRVLDTQNNSRKIVKGNVILPGTQISVGVEGLDSTNTNAALLELHTDIEAEALARGGADTTLQNNINSEITNRQNADLLKVDKTTGYIYLGIATTSTVPATYGANDRVYYIIDLPIGSTTLSHFGLSAIVLAEPTKYEIRWSGTAWAAIAAFDVDRTIIYSNEKATAEAINALNAKITALEDFINSAVLGNLQIDNLDIVKAFNIYGTTNLILSGTSAPSVTPDFIGQMYINTTAGITYQAKGVTSSGDWKQTSN